MNEAMILGCLAGVEAALQVQGIACGRNGVDAAVSALLVQDAERPSRRASLGAQASVCATACSHCCISSRARARDIVGWKVRSTCHCAASSSVPAQTPHDRPAR